MNVKKYIAVITLIFIGLISVNAQSKTTFGLQYKPILPIKVLNVTELKLSEKGMNVTLSPKLGLNFGAIIRWELLEKLSLETGLNYNKRSFKMKKQTKHLQFLSSAALKVLEDTPYKGLIDKLSNNILFVYYDGDIKDFSFINKLDKKYPGLDVLIYFYNKRLYVYDFVTLSTNKDIKGVFHKFLNTIKFSPLLKLTTCLKLAKK